MNAVKQQLIRAFEIDKLGFDMMGYTFKRLDELTYHHLYVSSKKTTRKTFKNGAILNGATAHTYLHLIEKMEPQIYRLIRAILIDEKTIGQIDIEHLKKIREALELFERLHGEDIAKSGPDFYVIKDDFREKRIHLS